MVQGLWRVRFATINMCSKGKTLQPKHEAGSKVAVRGNIVDLQELEV